MTADLPEPVDILAFAPHPDDVELCAGGLMLKAAEAGYRCAIVDFTRGEAGSRGTPEIRARESAAASEIMRLVGRENLGLPDAGLQVVPEMEAPVIRAYYGATIGKAGGDGLPAHRPDALIQYFGHLEPTPSFVVDISAQWEKRIELMRCYASQLGLDEADGPQTNIASPDFLRRVESRFAYWGARIGAEFGEPYRVDRVMPMDDPVATFRKRGWAVL
jgi:LmbE family N-acetylglucosaminyl deacetylase